MNANEKIWVALDTDKADAIRVAEAIADHPAVGGFKINRLIDQDVFRPDGEPKILDVLTGIQKPVWVDLKLHDVPRTVAGRVEPYFSSGQVRFLTVMAKGGIDMMMAAVEAGQNNGAPYESHLSDLFIIAVTELTSLSEEEIHLGSGQPSKASVIQLARNTVLSGVCHLVCSGKEVPVIRSRHELKGLTLFVPGITPKWKAQDQPDQKRVSTPEEVFKAGGDMLVIGGAIVNAGDPLEAVDMTAEEIEKI